MNPDTTLTITNERNRYKLAITARQWGVAGECIYTFHSYFALLHFLQAYFLIHQTPLEEEFHG
jgi:hypothetical protein